MSTFSILLACSLISIALSYEIIPIPSAPLVFGESPHWDSCSDSLFYTDILGTNFSIFRYDYYEGRVYPARIPNAGAASFIIPLKCCKNLYAVGLGRFVNVIKWNGKSQFAKIVRNITAVEQADAYSTNTIHTAKADAKGRLFFGTFRQGLCSSSSAPSGSLYSYSKKHGTRRVLGDINIPSGMAWNEDDKKFYLVNTCKFTLDEYNWNPKTGKISGGRTVFNFDASNGIPTSAPIGANIDHDGNIWVAQYNASSVVKINPKTSELLETIYLPTDLIVSVALGGPHRDTLFVTTATLPNGIFTGTPVDQQLSPTAGLVFMINGIYTKGYSGRKVCL